MTKKNLYLISGVVLIILAVFWGSSEQKENENVVSKDDIEVLLESLTLEQKVGQLIFYGYWGENSSAVLLELVSSGKVGGVMYMKPNVAKGNIKQLSDELQSADSLSRRGFPLLIAVDQEGGIVSRIKDSKFELTAQREVDSEEKAYSIALARGKALKEAGININFSPVLEKISNPDSFLYERLFRGDGEEITAFGSAFVRGYQENGVSASVKHFPGHDDNSLDSHKDLPESSVGLNGLREFTDIFRNVIRNSKPDLVMTSHVLFPSIDEKYPATLSPTLISYLRDDIGFDGIIITDDLNMGAITKKFGRAQVPVLAFKAGTDFLLYVAEPETIATVTEAILNAVSDGDITSERVDEIVYRILKLKKAKFQ